MSSQVRQAVDALFSDPEPHHPGEWHWTIRHATENFGDFMEAAITGYLSQWLTRPPVVQVHPRKYIPFNYDFYSVWCSPTETPTEFPPLLSIYIRLPRRYPQPDVQIAVRTTMPEDWVFYEHGAMRLFVIRIGDSLLHEIESYYQTHPTPQVPQPDWWNINDRQWPQWPQAKIPNDQIAANQQRARELLLSYCTQQQADDYATHKWFIVHGSNGGTYRIRRARTTNIEVLVDGVADHRLCTVTGLTVPLDDQLLAQKTMIELNESMFLQIAERWECIT